MYSFRTVTNDNAKNVIVLAELREMKRAAQQIPEDRFGDGPWKQEPNHSEWIDQDSGFPCMIVRDHMLGHLCGYVGVFEGHPCYGKHYDDELLDRVHVHGGLTYSSFKGGRRRAQIVKPGEPWWFGFDCAHAGDVIPALDVGALKKYKADLEAMLPDAIKTMGKLSRLQDRYRTFAFVAGEIGDLVAQLKAME